MHGLSSTAFVMPSSNFELSLPETDPDLNIRLHHISYPSHPYYRHLMNTYTDPNFKLDWSISQHLTLHDLKCALALDLDARSTILKRRCATVGLWTQLDGDETPLRNSIEQGYCEVIVR